LEDTASAVEMERRRAVGECMLSEAGEWEVALSHGDDTRSDDTRSAGIAEVWKSVGRALAEAMTSVSRTLGAGR
jgi:hypothetical protein